jgi:hypothetical protein
MILDNGASGSAGVKGLGAVSIVGVAAATANLSITPPHDR